MEWIDIHKVQKLDTIELTDTQKVYIMLAQEIGIVGLTILAHTHTKNEEEFEDLLRSFKTHSKAAEWLSLFVDENVAMAAIAAHMECRNEARCQ